MYHQPLHSLCTKNSNTISLNSYDLCVSYVEEHDENTVEFPHSHSGKYEIYYVIDGTMDFMVKNKVYTMTAGNFLFLNQGILHGTVYLPTQKKRYLTIVFTLQKRASSIYYNGLEEYEKSHMEAFFNLIEGKSHVIGNDQDSCGDYVQKMLQEFNAKRWGWFYKLQFLYSNFILDIIRNFVTSDQTFSLESNKNLPIEFTKYLHSNYQNPNLSLQDIAEHFYLSPRHANRLFKEFFGASLSKTLTQYRISYTKNYLIDTNYSIEEIADKVGFGSASTLSRLFKEVEGITISQWRYRYSEQMSQADSVLKCE